MRYQVPQFIEIEDKIFGPLTIKQFIYLAGGGGLSYLIYAVTNAFVPIYVVIVLILPVAGFSAALAFYKLNGKPFLNVVESAVKYYIGGKLYLWKKSAKLVVQKNDQERRSGLVVPKLANSKLKDLAWNLDVSQNPVEATQQDMQSKR